MRATDGCRGPVTLLSLPTKGALVDLAARCALRQGEHADPDASGCLIGNIDRAHLRPKGKEVRIKRQRVGCHTRWHWRDRCQYGPQARPMSWASRSFA